MGVGQSQVCMCGAVSKFIAHMTIYNVCHDNYSYKDNKLSMWDYKRPINLVRK